MSEPTPDDDENAVTERTPLVGTSGISTIQGTPALASASAWKSGRSRSTTLASSISSAENTVSWMYNPKIILSLCYSIVLVGSLSGGFQQIPMTRIYEDILCHEYYGQSPTSGEPIDEVLCKKDVIQSELAYLFAFLEALNSGIGCLVALLWGILADRIGRKPVYATATIGMIFHVLLIMIVGWFPDKFPVRWIWISSVAHLAGGPSVIGACTYSMVSDIIPESSRSIAFMRIHVASLAGNLVSPALASAMMSTTGPWPVMWLTIILWALAAALIAIIPETFRQPMRSDVTGSTLTFKTRALRGFNQLKDSLSIIRAGSVILILCICLLSMPVVMCTLQFMVQYISKHYHIPIAKTGYIQSVFGIAHIVVVLLIVPGLSKLVVQPTTPKFFRVANEKDRDLILARWSYVVYAIGSFILGVSPTLPVFITGLVVMSLGSGSASFIKSIATSHVDIEHRSRLFSIMALLDVGSNIWATPALAGLFTLGMRLGGVWIGLPYLGVSISCIMMLILALFVRTPRTDRDDKPPPELRSIIEDAT
ncbi:MFS general substrate transporter [Daldinia decipiens]|uniref:MFS general substrate transporter n=1 Tax=Daldinia decipiens TaxID=326647 RepID=UPI0020C3A462|nr:MFS general substrate transporter [Daldinia decipiens]KAI1653457.1 MFS general substrate transporter [Daldinia decipiens]